MNVDGLLKQNNGGGGDRRAWNIPLYAVWVPFFTATNAQGKTAIPAEALGAPLRLKKASDGKVKFSKTGRPQFAVARPLNDQIKLVRDNFIAQLQSFTNQSVDADSESYQAEVQKSQEAAKPLIDYDKRELEAAIERGEQAEAMGETPQAPQGEAPQGEQSPQGETPQGEETQTTGKRKKGREREPVGANA